MLIPEDKKKELEAVISLLTKNAEIELIILFGSFARGDWVSDRYKEGHITYEYQSDFDLLVVVKNEALEKNYSLWNDLETKLKTDKNISTTVSLIIETISSVNKKLLEGNYFYVDIKNEGVVLFDSGRFALSKPKSLAPTERKQLAQQDFDFWYSKAQSFLKDFTHNIEDAEFNNAAFHLHQAAEALFVSVLLVFTGYKPKTHNIEKVQSMCAELDKQFGTIFPKTSEQDKKLFDLLKRAYVDARYERGYTITLEQLTVLANELKKLDSLCKEQCTEKILSFV